MRAFVLIFVIVVVTTSAHGETGAACNADGECGAGECCQILSLFMVASKRDMMPISGKAGTCQLYKKEGDNCDTLDKMNGYCSCGPGLRCRMYQTPIPSLNVGRRGAPPPPQAGMMWVSKCEQV